MRSQAPKNQIQESGLLLPRRATLLSNWHRTGKAIAIKKRLVQLQPTPPSVPPESNPPVGSEPEPVFPTSAPDSTGIQVEKIVVTGNTILEAQINSIVQPLEGKTVTLEKLQKTTDEITQLYLNQGFLTSRAVLAGKVSAHWSDRHRGH